MAWRQKVTKSGGIGGSVAGAHETEGKVAFVGWPADDAPAKLALVYDGNKAVGAGRISLFRLDVAPTRQVQKLGFRIVIPSSGVGDPARLRFFSTRADGKVYELAITPTLRRHLEGMLASSRATPPGAIPNPDRR